MFVVEYDKPRYKPQPFLYRVEGISLLFVQS